MDTKIKLLFETILFEHGKPQNIRYHQKRVTKSAKELFSTEIDFELYLLRCDDDTKPHRCKVAYSDRGIESVEFLPYVKKPIKKLKAVFGDDISYGYKFLDRGGLDTLFAQKGGCDDVIIIKDGLLTDTSIANIALIGDDGIWVTPKTPLLRGTARERLLDEGKIVERDIECTDLFNYRKIALMNALRGFEIVGSTKEVIELGDIG